MSTTPSSEPQPPGPATPTPASAGRTGSSPPSTSYPHESPTLIDLFHRDPLRFLFFTCGLGIIGCFFAPWTRFDKGISAFDLCQAGGWGTLAAVLPALAIIALGTYSNEEARRNSGTITGILSWLTVFFFFKKVGPPGMVSLSWGASLTLLFGLGLFALSGTHRFAIPLDLAAKRLNSRKAEVFSHWGSVTPDIHFSAQDFYRRVEEAVRGKEWPGVKLLRVEYREAGLLSHSREYLRIIRQRQLFDVCAAGFGKDYFFSIREAEIPAVVDFRAFLVVALALAVLTVTFIQLLGLLFGFLALVVFVASIVWLLFNVLKMGLTQLDSILITLPVIGPVYEAWFRRDTYFQQDTRLFFLYCVSEMVKRHVAETTSASGLKSLHGFEKKPILDGLYKPFVLPLDPAR